MTTRSLALPTLAAAALLMTGCAPPGPPSQPPGLTLLDEIPCDPGAVTPTAGPAEISFDAQGNVVVDPDPLVVTRSGMFRWRAARPGLRWAVEVPDTLVAPNAGRKFGNSRGRNRSGSPRANATCGYYKYAVSAYLVTAEGDTLFDVADPDIMIPE